MLLFSAPGQHSCYEFIGQPPAGGRADEYQHLAEVRKLLETTWSHFQTHAENNFLDNFRKYFWGGWYELYLTHYLYSNNIRYEGRPGGPDFLLPDLGSIVLEATVLTQGIPEGIGKSTGSNYVSSLPLGKNGDIAITDVSEHLRENYYDEKEKKFKRKELRNPNSHKNLALRVTSSLHSKLKQYNKWKENSVLSECESHSPFIIAISGSALTADTHHFANSKMVGLALYGIDDLTLRLNGMGNVVDSHHEFRESMLNRAGSSVDQALFFKEEFSAVSAVLFVEHGFRQVEYTPQDVLIFHNPKAAAKLRSGILPCNEEWCVKDIDANGFSINISKTIN